MKHRCMAVFLDSIRALFIVAALLAILSFAYVNIKEAATGEMAFVAGYKAVYIESGSMEPAILRGSFVIIKQADFKDIKEGDIITFKKDGGFVTHRFIGCLPETGGNRGTLLITRGDANAVNDPVPAGADDIAGKVVYIAPF